tara:strand:- start:5759 stop:6193 length:435 start_codon:yes stop_codon:yes gene_type:complete
MILEICLALFSLIVIIIIFQFCKCVEIEKFENTILESEIKTINMKKQLMSTTEEFITHDDISLLEESTLQMLSGIQNIKNKLKKTEVDEEIDETLITELNETIYEEDEVDEEMEDGLDDEEDDEEDDIVEGFMERSTHNCQSFK